MEAVILAAGVGRRLCPLTKDVPKCMLKVGDRSLLSQILGNLLEVGIKEILVVTGHGAESVDDLINSFQGINIRCLYNPNYAQMNNCYSLWLTLKEVKDGFLIYNSDLLCGRDLVRKIIEAPPEDSLLVDRGKALGSEEMKVKLDEDDRISQISKDISPREAGGEYIGIAKFSRQGGEKLKGYLDSLIRKGRIDQFYEAAFDLLAKSYSLYGVCFKGEPWVEIDDFEDLKKAKEKIWPQIRERLP